MINNKDLKDTGFYITAVFPPKIYTLSEVMDDYIKNEYLFLEDFSKQDFKFINFEDEEIVIENDKNEVYRVFGKYQEGIFVLNKNKEVYLIPNKNSRFKEITYLNKTLHQFRKCYCLLLSNIFLMKAITVDENSIAKSFTKRLLEIDETTSKSVFYENYSYDFEELNTPLTVFNPIFYKEKGRHFIE